MAKRTKSERIADRASARKAAGRSISNRQAKSAAASSSSSSSSSSSPRPGSVAANRAAGTNKSAVNQQAKNNGTVRPGSVKYNRDQAKSNNQTMAQYKTANNINKSGSRSKNSRQLEARQLREGSVANIRQKAAGQNMTVEDYRKQISNGTQNNTNNQSAGGGVNENQALFDQYGQGLKGYANWYNAVGKQKLLDRQAEHKANNPNSPLAQADWTTLELTDKGLFNWDSTKPVNSLNTDMMKKFGIKGGDVIFDVSKMKSVNDYQGATFDGRLNAHHYDGGLAMPLRTDDSSHMKEHNQQMQRMDWRANASGTELASADGLFQDKYAVGYHSDDDKGNNFVGSQHSASINQADGKTLKEKINNYVKDGGYAGDGLKALEKHKHNLTSEKDIRWYNGLVEEAKAFDWEAKNQSWAGDAGGYYDIRAGGRAQNQTDEAKAEYMKQMQGGFTNDYDQNTSNQYQDNQYQQQNNATVDYSQFMPTMKGSSKFNTFQFDPFKFLQGQ